MKLIFKSVFLQAGLILAIAVSILYPNPGIYLKKYGLIFWFIGYTVKGHSTMKKIV